MPPDERKILTLGETKFALQCHVEDVCGEATDSGFGSMLFDSNGRVVLHDNSRTWIYTTKQTSSGRWMSVAREVDLRTLECGPSLPVLYPAPEDKWAVIHHVIRVEPERFVALFSSGLGVRAAMADTPTGSFRHDPEFFLGPEAGWEDDHSGLDGWSLEANGAYVKIAEDATRLEFWEGYDSYKQSERRGDLGWARLAFDKIGGRLRLIERHPRNPLDFRPDGFICARCGGNLASDVRIQGQSPFFYYARPDRSRLIAYVALDRDSLFQTPSLRQAFDWPRGDEEVIEKFQAYALDGLLHLLYESRLRDGSWRTGLRRYRQIA